MSPDHQGAGQQGGQHDGGTGGGNHSDNDDDDDSADKPRKVHNALARFHNSASLIILEYSRFL
jgi:hypothetical protein